MRRLLHRSQFLKIILCVTIICVLFLPSLQFFVPFAPQGSLYGYTDEVPSLPRRLVASFFDKSLQAWVEKYFSGNLGFRPLLIRSFNEVVFNVFRESSNRSLVAPGFHGLHNDLSINHLNEQLLNKDNLTKAYQFEADKIARVSAALKSKGKQLLVLIASSKTYIYPDDLGSRYLKGGAESIFDRAPSFGDILKRHGVNVFDSGPFLRQWTRESGIETHPKSGVHWNFYAACLVTNKMIQSLMPLEKGEQISPIDCGEPIYEIRRQFVDVDGLLLLNIWSDGGILTPSPFPSFSKMPSVSPHTRPKMIFIGDSFSDQIRLALKETNSYSRLVFSSYFVTREVDKIGNAQPPSSSEKVEIDEKQIRQFLEKDIEDSSVVVLQMVDYNINRLGYGFSDYFLNSNLIK